MIWKQQMQYSTHKRFDAIFLKFRKQRFSVHYNPCRQHPLFLTSPHNKSTTYLSPLIPAMPTSVVLGQSSTLITNTTRINKTHNLLIHLLHHLPSVQSYLYLHHSFPLNHLMQLIKFTLQFLPLVRHQNQIAGI